MKHYYALFSGGLDSTLAILSVISQQTHVSLMPLFFKYGQKSEAEEADAVRRLVPLLRQRLGSPSSTLQDCREFDIRGLFSWSESPILKSALTKEGSPDVENRNMILIGCAASVIMADWKKSGKKPARIVVGFKNEHYDTRKTFADRIDKLFQAADMPIFVDTPLIPARQKKRISSRYLAELAQSLHAFELLNETGSCYYPQNGEPCNSCLACDGREELFNQLRRMQTRKM